MSGDLYMDAHLIWNEPDEKRCIDCKLDWPDVGMCSIFGVLLCQMCFRTRLEKEPQTVKPVKNLADHKVIVTYRGEDSIWALFASSSEVVTYAEEIAKENPHWGVRIEFAYLGSEAKVIR